MASKKPFDDSHHVPETRFGIWFLRTETWRHHVLRVAIKDLERLIVDRRASYPTIVDVGCGCGYSFELLAERFAPSRMIGIEVDEARLAETAAEVARPGLKIELHHASCAALPLPDRSADMLFCHQTFHHLVHQDAAIREFHRVLRPGGLLLFAESTRAYIHSWLIRYLFRHPMDLQKTATEYVALIQEAGFAIPEGSVSFPYLWWSRPDLGIKERWFRIPVSADREETLVNAVAIRLDS